MRCTAPMKAPRPPPTMPRRMRSFMSCPPRSISADAEHPPAGGVVALATGKVVERVFGHLDDMTGNERRAFRRASFGMLERAFPFQHRPAGIAVLGQFREDAVEVDLPVAQRAEAAGALDPA